MQNGFKPNSRPRLQVQVYTKEEFHVESPQVNIKALTYKGRGCVWAQQSRNSNSILGLQQARFYHVVSFGNTAEVDQTRVCDGSFPSYRMMCMSAQI